MLYRQPPFEVVFIPEVGYSIKKISGDKIITDPIYDEKYAKHICDAMALAYLSGQADSLTECTNQLKEVTKCLK